MPTLASPRLLKPDRTIIAPGDPGWDDAIPDRPRSRWWRTLLAGRARLTRLQPGSCCGCTVVTPCSCGGLPLTLYATDTVLGKVTLINSFGTSWDGTATVTVTGLLMVSPTCNCSTTSSGSMTVSVRLQCLNGSTGQIQLRLTYTWGAVGCGGCSGFPAAAQPPFYYVLDGSTINPCQKCGGTPQNPGVNSDQSPLTSFTNCSTPMSFALTMSGAGVNTPSPAGTNVTVTDT